MPLPTASDVHVNAPLTNISIAYIQSAAMYIATKVFPNVPVSKQSDRYFVYDKGDWMRTEAEERAPGAESAGGGWRLDNTPNYFAPLFAIHKDVDDQIRANADPAINMDRDATQWVTQQLLIKRDKIWASKYFATGVWSADIVPTTLWDAAGSTPIEDITAQIIDVTKATGFKPNVFVAGAKVFDTLRNHADTLDRIKHTQKGVITEDILASLLGVDKFLVAWSVENTAAEAATASMSYISTPEDALLVYSAPSASLLHPTGGYTFSWTGLLGAGAEGNRIKRFRIDERASDRIEGEMAFDMKLVASDVGVFFNGAVS